MVDSKTSNSSESQDAWRIGRNTVGYGILFIVIGLIAAVTIAHSSL